jgi:hypothetical protein
MSERQPYANTQRTNYNRKGRFDIHAWQNEQIRSTGDEDAYRISSPATGNETSANRGGVKGTEGSTGFEDLIVQFDSTYHAPDTNRSNGEIRWIISELNGKRDVLNCMAVSITPFQFPNVWQTTLGPTNGVPILNNRKVYLTILGLPFAQSALGFNDLQYHWECSVEEITDLTVLLVPRRPTFFFRRPILTMSELRIKFSTVPTSSDFPLYPPIMIPDYQIGIQANVPGTNPITLTLLIFPSIPGFRITSVIGPQTVGPLATPVPVFIRGVATGVPAVDDSVNSDRGVYITAISGDDQFTIAGIDATTILSSSIGIMFIQKNRIFMPMRFTNVADGPTNYITVNHQ